MRKILDKIIDAFNYRLIYKDKKHLTVPIFVVCLIFNIFHQQTIGLDQIKNLLKSESRGSVDKPEVLGDYENIKNWEQYWKLMKNMNQSESVLWNL